MKVCGKHLIFGFCCVIIFNESVSQTVGFGGVSGTYCLYYVIIGLKLNR